MFLTVVIIFFEIDSTSTSQQRLLSLLKTSREAFRILEGVFYESLSVVVSSKISFGRKLSFTTWACFPNIIPDVFLDALLAEPM